MNKKFIFVLVMLLVSVSVTALFVGCTDKNLTVENHDWTFILAQSVENGEVIYCSEEFSGIYENAKTAEFSCEADGTRITFTDKTDNEKLIFAYETDSSDGGGIIYRIKSDGADINGFASVGITEYADGKKEYTLYITFNNISYKFNEKI